jgi:hypothetical protein
MSWCHFYDNVHIAAGETSYGHNMHTAINESQSIPEQSSQQKIKVNKPSSKAHEEHNIFAGDWQKLNWAVGR